MVREHAYLSPARLRAFLPFLALLLLLVGGCHRGVERFEPDPDVDYSLGMFHRVRSGESLSGIARFYQRDMQLVARLNELTPPYVIHIDSYLYLPPDNSDRIVRTGRVSLAQVRSVRERLNDGRPQSEVPRKQAKVMKRRVDKPARSRVASSHRSKPSTPAPRRVTSRSGKVVTEEVALAPPRRGKGPRFAVPLQSYRYSRGYSDSNWRKSHLGLDLAAPSGKPIFAAASGTVLNVGKIGAYGNTVVLDHGGGYSTLYAHASEILVRQGQSVREGQSIALVGSTGRSTGPHLHFEVRYNGVATDPERHLAGLKKEGNRLLASRK